MPPDNVCLIIATAKIEQTIDVACKEHLVEEKASILLRRLIQPFCADELVCGCVLESRTKVPGLIPAAYCNSFRVDTHPVLGSDKLLPTLAPDSSETSNVLLMMRPRLGAKQSSLPCVLFGCPANLPASALSREQPRGPSQLACTRSASAPPTGHAILC